tara:strand:- start:2271 stop:2747 length:477 start_codon:yes stop_codon:yes gene_type:complete
MIYEKLNTLLMAMFPVGELRVSIPLAYHGLGLSWFDSYIYSLVGNSLIALILLFIISFIGRSNIRAFFKKIPFLGYLYLKWEQRSIEKSKSFKNLSFLGLTLFVGIPLPVTGAWTAVLISVILKLNPIKSYLFITYGLFISGAIITYLTIFLPDLLKY